MRARLLCLVCLSLVANAVAQLAITEVMPVSKVNTNSGFHGAEFWELTNFGTNEMNLHGYGFRDSNPLRSLRRQPFTNLVLRAGESVIFFRLEPNNDYVVAPEHFKAWWGQSKLPAPLQCRIYENPGLSAWDGDEVWVFDAAGRYVDSVRFNSTRAGFSFTYDPVSGHFGAFSSNGVNNAFTADLTPDVGSPGTNSGAISVHFTRQPASIEADGGMSVTFSPLAGGMPPPRYQWLFEGAPLAGATLPTLTLSNVQPSDAGGYRVVITNGLSTATSSMAQLIVNTQPKAPSITRAPTDTTVFIGQTAAFAVSARGYPPPAYQWQTNGTDIPGAVSSALELSNVGAELNGARISVVVSNAAGSTTAEATLTVTHWPDLRFTEVMAVPARAEENRVFGWVELTNFDTNAIDLLGWRFAEEDSFARAVTITNAILLAPGESLVIAERLDRARFAQWWGERALPENFKLHPYSGFGLEPFGGTFFLWNAAARDPHGEWLTAVSWASSVPGISYECDYFPEFRISEASRPSSLGVGGAFISSDGADLASPGYTVSPLLKIVSVSRGTGGVALTCKVTVGKTYRLWRSGSLAPATWVSAQTVTASNNLVTFTEQAGGESAFYHVEELP